MLMILSFELSRYVFGFYIDKCNPQQIFDDNQAHLEDQVEGLSGNNHVLLCLRATLRMAQSLNWGSRIVFATACAGVRRVRYI